VGGITGGAAGTGEGATMNINRVQNLTNNMYVGDIPCPFFESPFSTTVSSGGSLVVHSNTYRLLNFSGLNTFQSELFLDSKKFCTSGWGLPLIQKTDSASSKASITTPLGAGS
jgi:hypothetical protein